ARAPAVAREHQRTFAFLDEAAAARDRARERRAVVNVEGHNAAVVDDEGRRKGGAVDDTRGAEGGGDGERIGRRRRGELDRVDIGGAPERQRGPCGIVWEGGRLFGHNPAPAPNGARPPPRYPARPGCLRLRHISPPPP